MLHIVQKIYFLFRENEKQKMHAFYYNSYYEVH